MFNVSILYLLIYKFYLGNLPLFTLCDTCYTMHWFFYIENNYVYTFQVDILHVINYIMCVLYRDGHHESNRLAVLVMVSQAENIAL